jgi:beta-lactamase regulating signal transducer with metallopeptidase domain
MLYAGLFQLSNAAAIWSINLAIKAVVVLAITAAAIWMLRRSSAASRHQVITIATFVIILMPLLTILIPSWNLELIPGFQEKAVVAPAGYVPGQMAENAAAQQIDSWSVGTWIILIWAAGAGLMLLRLFAGRILGMRTIMNTRQETDDRLNEILEVAIDRVGINKSIMLLRSPAVKVPVIYGSIFPRLILPTKANEWPDERLEAIFIHELSHIKRYDILTQTLAQLVCCIHWFNPLTWVLERRMMIERERACDDMVLINGKRASEYARHLMESAGALGARKNPAWAMVAMAEGTDFKDRVLSILDPNARRSAPRIAFSALAGIVAALLMVPFVAAQPFALKPVQINLENSSSEIEPAAKEQSYVKEDRDQNKEDAEDLQGINSYVPTNDENGEDGNEVAGKLFHGFADILESTDEDTEAGEFVGDIFDTIANAIPENEEGGKQGKQVLKAIGNMSRYKDNPKMLKKKTAEFFRVLGNISEADKSKYQELIDKSLNKSKKKK